MEIQFKVKYKINFKWNLKCKWKWISPWPSDATTIMLRALTNRADNMLACNMAEWRQFANKQRQTWGVKGKRPARESVEAKDEIIVQRMSSEVTGKQQKYTRIGPREFVPFEFDEITFDNRSV